MKGSGRIVLVKIQGIRWASCADDFMVRNMDLIDKEIFESFWMRKTCELLRDI